MLRRAIASPLPTQRHEHLVAEGQNRIVGFAAAQVNRSERDDTEFANFAAILVAPKIQRQGIGCTLHNAMLARLKDGGVTRMQIGGLYPRLWPGIPANLPGAKAFFAAMGWDLKDHVVDLARDVRDYEIPGELRQRMASERLTLEPANAGDVETVLELERRYFPGWLQTTSYVASVGDFRDFLVARDADKGIVGALVMTTPDSHPSRVDALWTTVLGEKLGAMNEVGVAESERGRGIGIALVAWGSETLKQRGVHKCTIGWTDLIDFYGKAGYRPWQEFDYGWRTL
jgi:GNAT superfamily N-acetyltransferase